MKLAMTSRDEGDLPEVLDHAFEAVLAAVRARRTALKLRGDVLSEEGFVIGGWEVAFEGTSSTPD